MKEFLLSSAEKLLNTYLAADPEIAARLDFSNGKSIIVNLSDLQFSYALIIESRKIKLTTTLPEHFNTKVKGRSFSLLRLLTDQAPANSVIKGTDIEIEGEVLFLQNLRDIFSSIEIDWDDFFSPYLGDVLSRQVTQGFKKVFQVAKKNSQLFKKNISLYVQEEVQLFPPQEEIRDWYDDVVCLRDDVERAEARLENLLKNE